MENSPIEYTTSTEEEIAARNAEIEESLALLKIEESAGIIQHCTCGTIMQKIAGCNWVKCHCAVEWCWVCRKKKSHYEPGQPLAPTETACPYGSPGCNSH